MEDDYLNGKLKVERKTADSDEEEGILGKQADLPDLCLHDEMIEVAGFQRLNILEPESEWLSKLEGGWELQDDYDDIFGY